MLLSVRPIDTIVATAGRRPRYIYCTSLLSYRRTYPYYFGTYRIILVADVADAVCSVVQYRYRYSRVVLYIRTGTAAGSQQHRAGQEAGGEKKTIR